MKFAYNASSIYKQGDLKLTTPVYGSQTELLKNTLGQPTQSQTQVAGLELGIVVPGGEKVTKPSAIETVERLDPQGFPHQPRIKGGAIPATLQNVNHLVTGYGITLGYDVIKKKISVRIPGLSGSRDNLDNSSLAHIMSLATLNGMRNGQVPMYLETLADMNLENPVLEWVKFKAWDGVDRVAELCATLETQEGYSVHLKETLIRKWLRSGVAALYVEGFRSRGVLTLQGGQSIGKTTWILNLLPPGQLRDAVIKLDHHLDASNKDSILSAVSHWIVEIGELDSSFRKDVARLKGFLTSNSDKVRRPYAKGESDYARRTVFAATVNDTNFLVDPTGNTRFWVLPVRKIHYNHGIDMQQVFAQILEEVEQGESWHLTKEEELMLEDYNSNHKSISVIEEDIKQKYVKPYERKNLPKYVSATEVLKSMEYESPTNPQFKDANRVLTELYGEPKRINGVNKWRAYEKPFNPYDLTDEDDEDLY